MPRNGAFRDARRCLIVADGFYEWEKRPGGTSSRGGSRAPTARRSPSPGCGRPGARPRRRAAAHLHDRHDRGNAARARPRPHAGDPPARRRGRVAGPRHRPPRCSTSACRSSRRACAPSAPRSTTRATTSPTASSPPRRGSPCSERRLLDDDREVGRSWASTGTCRCAARRPCRGRCADERVVGRQAGVGGGDDEELAARVPAGSSRSWPSRRCPSCSEVAPAASRAPSSRGRRGRCRAGRRPG